MILDKIFLFYKGGDNDFGISIHLYISFWYGIKPT